MDNEINRFVDRYTLADFLNRSEQGAKPQG
jgi:hypothetical protein